MEQVIKIATRFSDNVEDSLIYRHRKISSGGKIDGNKKFGATTDRELPPNQKNHTRSQEDEMTLPYGAQMAGPGPGEGTCTVRRVGASFNFEPQAPRSPHSSPGPGKS